MTPTKIATTNLKFTMSDDDFATGLERVLATHPDLVAIQEAGKNRDRIIQHLASKHGYRWTRPHSPNGDPTMPVMWNTDRYEFRSTHAVRLARREFVGHLPGRKSKLPASWATELVVDDLAAGTGPDGRKTVLINYHLTAEVQEGGRYRRGWRHRLRVARHKHERRRLWRRGRMHRRRGRIPVFLAGDSNYHGMEFRRFQSCWRGIDNAATLGNRAVDAVYISPSRAPARPPRVIKTGSDHRAVVVSYE